MVNGALCLTGGTLNGTGLYNLDVGLDTYHTLDTGGEALAQTYNLINLVCVELRLNLNLDIKCIGIVDTVNLNKEVRFVLGELKQDRFNL